MEFIRASSPQLFIVKRKEKNIPDSVQGQNAKVTHEEKSGRLKRYRDISDELYKV